MRARPRDLAFEDGIAVPPPAERRRVLLATVVLLAAIVGAFVLGRSYLEQSRVARLGNDRPPIPVTMVTAQTGRVPRVLSGIGTLEAVHQITVAPEIGGRITNLSFTPGQMVSAGDLLVQINDEPERADRANFQAQARLASATLARSKELNARDFQSRQVVDQQQSLLDQAEAGIAKADAEIAQKMIRAPFSGQLGVRLVDVGSYLNPGGAIVTLTDLSTLWVNFTLAEQAAPDVQVGQDAHIKVDAWPGRIFPAKVTAIEPQISAQTRTILVQATIDNPGHLLLPGMFANAELVLPDAAPAVLVPETAVDYSLYGDSAFVIHEDGKDGQGRPRLKVTRVPVQVGDRADGKIAILSGLSAGDRVVASGQLKLSNGASVAIEPGDPLATLPSAKTY